MRPLITSSTWGTCYLLHFSAPLGNPANTRAQAQHYIGWADDLEQHIAEHLAGRGARITRAAVAQGITFEVVATWHAPLGFEKVLKRRKEAPKLCALCAQARGQRAKRATVRAEQLVLPLDLADVDIDPFPVLPARSMDGYEAWMLGRMRQAGARAVAVGEWNDEGLL